MDDLKSWFDDNGVEHKGRIEGKFNEFEVIHCQLCDFKHVIPLPKSEELEKLYSEEYYSKEKSLYIERYVEDKEWWDITYDQRFTLFESYLQQKGRSLLDVGSGPGLFLKKGQELGWIVKGIEPSTQAVKYSREVLKLDIEENFLDVNLAKNLGQFDVVNLGEVIEHLSDPTEMLKIVNSMLHNGGLISIIAPNDFNPFQLLLENSCDYDPWWIAPPHHLNYFDKESLSKLLDRCGFEVVHNETTFPIDMFLLMSENYIGNDDLGRSCHTKRMNFDLNIAKNPILNARLKKAFAALDLGRDLLVIGRKRA
jgi:2-polyprenyl-3-methyl-5-hydroxy-6-metoxy-1,4-benzoquinol methylase